MLQKENIEIQIRIKAEVKCITGRKKSMKCGKKGGKESACVCILGFRHYMCLFMYVFVCFKPIIIIFYHTRRIH